MLDVLTLAADDWSFELFGDRLGDRLEVAGRSKIRVSFLDTFDWRLFRKGCLLTREFQTGETSLHWLSPSRQFPYVYPVEGKIRCAHDLPDGFLKTELLKISGVRALLTVGVARGVRQSGRVLDADGNAVARLLYEQLTVLDESNTSADEPLNLLRVQPIGMARGEYQRLIRDLHESGASDRATPGVLEAAAAVRGRHPGDYVAKPHLSIQPTQRSDEALKMILGHLRSTVAVNVDGVINDLDVEFLHDLRVACRRSRVALSQLKKVLPQSDADYLAGELKWLGEFTSACRDLDVYLLEMDMYRRQLGDGAAAIDDFEKLLRRERAKALRRVRRGLRSKRFTRFLNAWGEVVDSGPSDESAPHAAKPVAEVAGTKILKAYRRMLKRGTRLPDRPPAEDLHRLRIDAKKLRYLLEFFGGLWPKKTIARLVRELKLFQDILGGANDMAVQQRHLAAFAETLMAEGSTKAGTLFAMGRLADTMAARQEEYAGNFADRFELFAGEASRNLYQKTFAGD